MTAFKSRVFHISFLIFLTFVCYINIFYNGFSWDDKDFLLNWPQIKNAGDLPSYLSLPDLLMGDLPSSHRGVYRPIRSAYYLVSYGIWGENPFGYHLQSIILQSLIVITVYLTLELITKKKALSFIVSIFFATHPIHTESVTYITASFDNLGILFFFLSFYLYLKARSGEIKRNLYLFGSVIYGFFAFFTYEMTLVLPLVIILYEFCINNFSAKKVFSKINSYKHYILLLVIYILARFVILGIGNRADYLGVTWAIAANQVRVNMPEIFAHYIWWLILPINLTISPDIPQDVLLGFLELLGRIDPSGNLIKLSTNIAFLFPIFYALCAIFLAYILLKKYPIIFFGFSFIVISILPVSNIIPQGASAAERFLYIPSFGYVLLLGFLLYKGIAFRFKPLSYFSLILIIFITAFYIFQTINRNMDWKDEKTIWQKALSVDPNNPLPLRALASIYFQEDNYDKALDYYNKVLDVSDPSAQLNSQIGFVYEKKGEIKQAIEQQKKALDISPEYYFAHIALGDIYLKDSEFDLAEKEYKSALEINKNHPVILFYLGNVYFSRQNYTQALTFYKKALEYASDSIATASKISYQIGVVEELTK